LSGSINAGGLITGLDSNSIIQQLIALERQPITRARSRISALEAQRNTVRELRTQLQTLRNRLQDFRLNNIFNSFQSSSSKEEVLTASVTSSSPVVGAFAVNVTQLASATTAHSSARLGASINPAAALNSSGISTTVEAGAFTINGVQFTIDPATQSLEDILATINGSSAGVTATYNAASDTVSFENNTPGDTSIINFGADDDESNFLEAIAIKSATQATGGGGSTTATSTRNLGAISPTALLNTVNFGNGAIAAGTFSINGISFSVDPTTDTLNDVLSRINNSDARVSASYDASTDSIRFVSQTLGSRTIKFGGAGDTSNFLGVTNLTSATQQAGNDAQFTINGGPVLTRNTNEVNDAISGVTIKLLSTGESTVTVNSDNDKIVEKIKEFVDEFNKSVAKIREVTGNNATLKGDGGIRNIESFLRDKVFSQVSGVGSLDSLLAIGISTGEDFDASAASELKLNEDKLREALTNDRQNVKDLFSNTGKTGIADLLFDYLDEATKTTGFLNERARSNGTIDQQIRSLNDQITRLEERLSQKEARLRRQFATLEQMSAGFQNQNAALARIGAGARLF
jgi:flagellar hook-associated protein 2